MMLQTVAIGKNVGVDMAAKAVRYDLPSLVTSEEVTTFSFEQQVENSREEKRKLFAERVTLLKEYWNVRVKQILHEDFYRRTNDMRDTVVALRKRADDASKEITQLKKKVADCCHHAAASSSMWPLIRAEMFLEAPPPTSIVPSAKINSAISDQTFLTFRMPLVQSQVHF